jgi:hypothetical protein
VNFTKRLLMMIGVVALAATFGALVAPKTTHALVATLVQVVNTTANPVPTNDVDQPGKHPYQASVIFNQDATNCTSFVCTANFPAVPAGYRLVITNASALYGLTPGGAAPNVALVINGNIFGARFLLPLPQPDGFDTYIVSSPVTFYVEAGDQPSLLLGGQFVSPVSISAEAAISGYLVPTT